MKTFAISGSRGYRIPVSYTHLAGKSPGQQSYEAAQSLVHRAVLSMAATGEFDTFVHGGADGPDSWAEEGLMMSESLQRDILRSMASKEMRDPLAIMKLLDQQIAAIRATEILTIAPDYDAMPMHLKKRAPLICNTEIAKQCDLLLVFWDGQSRGTLDTMLKAHRAGKEVMMWGRNGKPIQGEKLSRDLDGLARRASWRASN